MDMQYRVINIDGGKLIANTPTNDIEHISFQINFKSRLNLECCDIEAFRPDNPLFFQIRDELGLNERDAECLVKNIVFVDFSSYFKSIQGTTRDYIIKMVDGHDIGTQGKTRQDKIKAEVLKTILDPDKGINITFEDGETISYCVFDKSSSMARKCSCSFINKEIREVIDERLRIGIDFNELKMVLSKYYAYRGLYLSTSVRIPEKKSKFELNEKTVVIIKDKKNKYQEKEEDRQDFILKDGEKKYNMMPPQFTVDEQNPVGPSGEHNFTETRCEVTTNAFDGEGLISPQYAKYINSVKHSDKNWDVDNLRNYPATSYQVRYCYVKGMLHTVNFKQFYEDYFPNEPMYIEDCFGHMRDLKDIQIILTESMFKCKKWLKDYWDTYVSANEKCEFNNDIVKFFFEKAKKYKHTLYISEDNASLKRNDIEQLNYQYLSTLNLSHNEFQELMDGHFSLGKDEIFRMYTRSSITVDTDPIVAAAQKNPIFYNEPKIVENVANQIKKLGIDCGMGRLYANGMTKYLSGDLFTFLRYLAANTYLDTNKSQVIKSDKSATKAQHVDGDDDKGLMLTSAAYLPGMGKEGSNSTEYALFRSPHLSRNEQCLSSPNIIQEEGKDNPFPIYDNYFRHLKGIIMVPDKYLIPASLGGSDYDGDHTKLFFDEKIVNAVKNACYDPNIKKQGIRRRTPVVMIPDEGSEEVKPSTKETIKLLINTFSNQIGYISNLAIKFAVEQYKTDKNPLKRDYCALCTAVTGMEIDASKRGVHPVKDIKFLEDACKTEIDSSNKNSNYFTGQKFLEAKDFYERLSSRPFTASKKENEGKYNTYEFSIIKNGYWGSSPKSSQGYQKGKLVVAEPDAQKHNLFSLLWKSGEYFNERAKKDWEDEAKELFSDLTKRCDKDTPHFKFEKNEPAWKKALQKETEFENNARKIHELIDAYYSIMKDIKSYNNTLSRAKNSQSYNKLLCLLRMQHELDFKTGELSSNIQEYLENTIIYVKSLLPNAETVKSAMKRLVDLQWQFADKSDRVKVLKEILGAQEQSIIDPNIELILCNFSESGYFILYYMLDAILQDYQTTMSIDGLIETVGNNTKKNYYADLLNCYNGIKKNITKSNEFTANYDESGISDTKSTVRYNRYSWQTQFNLKCQKLLFEILGAQNAEKPTIEETEKAIKYFGLKSKKDCKWQLPVKDGDFFWDVVPCLNENFIECIYQTIVEEDI